ncbi:hypothetical protein [Deinococcus aquatilis]|uniref:hypothetical protein n=1 Tax=Deinococcus aquatilis TaxID=519440 RepID=UPI0012F841B8|nr:hypothetical protein [Deinococcus aquatilis]
MSALEDQGGRAKPGRLAAALQTNIPALTAWLEELVERGLVRRVQTGLHVEWERVNWVLDKNLVCEAYMPRITALLLGRRELASRIAQELSLPRVEVEETCRAMMLAGQLVGTPVQATYVYSLGVRAQVRVDWDVVARVETSPGAVFQRGLRQRLEDWGQDGVRPLLDDGAARAEPSGVPLNALPLPCPPTEPAVLPRVQVTLAVEEQLRELLPGRQRRRAGETARVAALLGLSVRQVRRALARIPVEGGSI